MNGVKMKITSRREVDPPENIDTDIEEDEQSLPVPDDVESYEYYQEDWVIQGALSFSIIPH